MKYELIIFDLDGTLLDTSKGIFNSVRYAEAKMGFPPVLTERLNDFIGPPPKEMYMKIYGINEENALMATKYHREYGRTKAIFEAELYSGAVETLTKLKKYGYKLAVATLKDESIAKQLLHNFGLNIFFDIILGMDKSESRTKADLIRTAIKQTGTNGRAVLIGDSLYDAEGASEAGVSFIGALYGFGLNKDMTYNSIGNVDKFQDILNLL